MTAIANEYAWPGYVGEPRRERAIDQTDYEEYAGEYETRSGGVRLHILRRDDSLYRAVPHQPLIELRPVGGTTFFTRELTIHQP